MSELFNISKLPFHQNNVTHPEVIEIIKILDIIENHTAELRKKIMGEISKDKNNIRLNLDSIDN